jgi:FkbM family methyltransferase
MFLWGTYEEDVSTALRLMLGPGMRAVDVGANCGVLSLVMAEHVGSTGRVISVDPSPVACRRIEEQARFNNLTNVLTVCRALGEDSGETEFLEGGVGIGVLPKVDAAFGAARHVPVTVEPLDAVLERLNEPSIDLMKLDTDGSEPAVLAGAHRTLARFRPALVFEVFAEGMRRRGHRPADVAGLLEPLGYRLLRPLWAAVPAWSARPARLRGFEPLTFDQLAAGRADGLNLIALNASVACHGAVRERLLAFHR